MKSIREYLRTRVLLGSAVILAAGFAVLALAIRRLDIHEFDQHLEDRARLLASQMKREGNSLVFVLNREYWPEFQTEAVLGYFQFRFTDGSVILRSESLGDGDLPLLPSVAGKPSIINTRLPDGRRGRMIQFALTPQTCETHVEIHGAGNPDAFHVPIPGALQAESSIAVLGFAHSREKLDALLLTVYLTLAGMVLLILGLIAILLRRVLRRGFLSIEEMNAQIRGLGPEDMRRRVTLATVPGELEAVVSSLNQLLDRLDTSLQHERRFISDVAHELRTPVAEFRAACEVGGKWADDPALVARRFANLRESAANMEQMLNDLLDLSRLDRGAVQISPVSTGMAALADSCWARVCSSGAGTGHPFENRIDRALRLAIDPPKLEQIVFNLLDNAAQYSPPGAAVVCTGELDGGLWELCFSNPVQDLEQKDLEHLFERFWRKDAARTAGGHAGLGLSIVEALAGALGIRVAADLAGNGVFTIRLRFPARASMQGCDSK
ncbi:MAG: ATP-binding protein [Kiritimatiellia bacterium]|jgi:signal transduction histidine kinase